MKGALGLRPVFYYREDRIRAHGQLCWLVLLLLRVIENATGDTWRNVRHELDRMHLITLATADGHVAQRSTTTPGRRASWPRSSCPNRRGSSTSPPQATNPGTRPHARRSNTTLIGHSRVAQVIPVGAGPVKTLVTTVWRLSSIAAHTSK